MNPRSPIRTQRRRDTGRPISREQHYRARFVFWCLLLGFGWIAINLVRLHQFPDERLGSGERGRIGEATTTPPRGKIHDGHGRVLALDRMVPSLYADPSRIVNPHEIAQMLSTKLDVDEDLVASRLTRRKSNGDAMESVPIKRWLTEEEYDRIHRMKNLAQHGLYFREEPARYYPEGQLASHVLGYVNRESVGSAGVEARYNDFLTSKTGRRKGRVDSNRHLLESLTLEYQESEPGADIWLTLMNPLQDALERELAAVMERVQADRANGIVMDPKTGAILAMASAPDFDPNDYGRADERELKNTTIQDVFEPGSTFKIVTVAAALEQEIINTNTMIDCENGAYRLHRHTINDLHRMGVVPVTNLFAESSNIGTVKIAQRLGEQSLSDWIARFGFGERASQFFPGESAGIFVSDVERWSKLSIGALPIGQEIAVTTMQLARAYCAIANGGLLVQPYIVDHVQNAHGETIFQHDAPIPDRIISEQTSQTMRELCHLVVTDGTGHRASLDEFRVCGKTGTGQVARPREEGGGYYPNRVTTVFSGFAPLRDPQVVCVIVVHDPKMPKSYGGNVCGPVFREVVRQALLLLGTPRDPLVKQVADQSSADQQDADTIAHAIQPLDPLQELFEAELMRMAKDDLYGDSMMPDFNGMTLRQARARLAGMRLQWRSEGSGRVIRQTPAPGTPINDVDECILVFGASTVAEADEPAQSLPANGD